MGKHPLFSGTDRDRKSHLRDGGQTRSFTATMALRVRQPWGSVSFTVIVTVRVGRPWGSFSLTVIVTVRVGQTNSGDARD
jgi:hypothetical protein